MPTLKQSAAEMKRILAQKKKDTIAQVYSSAMHILYGSDLQESGLWPKQGFNPGYGGEFTKSDSIMVGVSIGTNHQMNVSWQTVNLNIINKTYSRAKKQGIAIDKILDCSDYDGVYFTEAWPESLERHYKYNSRDWCYGTKIMYYVQIQFTFTIQQQ